MNNLHRQLAPVSDEAWAQLEAEAARTFRRYLAGRRVIDVPDPGGIAFAAVGTGHASGIEPPGEGVRARQRQVLAAVELRAAFALDREQIDDVARGALDADWQPVKDAARQLAFAEDRVIFDGYPAAAIVGIREGAGNPPMVIPADPTDYPEVVAQAVSQLRSAGVGGPYAVALSAEAYTAASETTDHGYPVLEQIRRLVSGEIIWAPAITGGCVLTTRGGDFEFLLGQDASIGYLSHDEATVTLYLEESLIFRLLTSEAAVSLTWPAG